VILLDEHVIGTNPVIRAELQQVIKEKTAAPVGLPGQGFTAPGRSISLANLSCSWMTDSPPAPRRRAAVLSAKKQAARQVRVAAPVASVQAIDR